MCYIDFFFIYSSYLDHGCQEAGTINRSNVWVLIQLRIA